MNKYNHNDTAGKKRWHMHMQKALKKFVPSIAYLYRTEQEYIRNITIMG